MIVAIVGRPNVGKSTVFNRIVGRRLAIVHPSPGVTRDRVFAYAEWQGKVFGIFDTGGFWPDKDLLSKEIANSISHACQESDLILFVIDGRVGVLPLDMETYRMIRKQNRRIIIVVNKLDNPGQALENIPFREKVFMVSAVHGHGFFDLLDEITAGIETVERRPEHLRLLILGRPNVGKSTLLNQITGMKRAVVEPTPGTTRDPLSEFIVFQKKRIEIIDTAGIRRKSRINSEIEFFSVIRALRLIPGSDVVILLFDGVEGPVKQDLRLAELVLLRGRGLVIAPNKIDLTRKGQDEVLKMTQRIFRFLPWCPVVPISALKGTNVNSMLKVALSTYEQGRKELEAGLLKKFLKDLPPPPGRNRILGMKQTGTLPPVFEIKTRERLPENYLRFLRRKLREFFQFSGQPIIIRPRWRN